MNLQKLISQATAARIRGVDRAAIADLIKRGRLRAVNIAGVPYLYEHEVRNFVRLKPGPKPTIEKRARRS